MFNLAQISSQSSFNWYGFLIGAGMVACIVLAYFMAKSRKFYSDVVFDIAVCCIPLAIVGARLGYIIFDITGGNSTLADWPIERVLGLDGNGLSGLMIYGGLITAVMGSLIVVLLQKRKPEYEKITWLEMADLGFTLIILGQVIGRWGNFANQEAYGNIVTDKSLQWFPYAVFIEAKNSWFQATFFYESMWNLIGFIFLMWSYNGRRKSFSGFNFAFYCIWYGVGRFFIEGLRSDSLWLVPGVIRVSQLISIMILLVGIAIIVFHIVMARRSGKKVFILVDKNEMSLDYYSFEKTIFYRSTLVTDEERAKKKKEEENYEPEFEEVDDSDRYWEVDQDVEEVDENSQIQKESKDEQ